MELIGSIWVSGEPTLGVQPCQSTHHLETWFKLYSCGCAGFLPNGIFTPTFSLLHCDWEPRWSKDQSWALASCVQFCKQALYISHQVIMCGGWKKIGCTQYVPTSPTYTLWINITRPHLIILQQASGCLSWSTGSASIMDQCKWTEEDHSCLINYFICTCGSGSGYAQGLHAYCILQIDFRGGYKGITLLATLHGTMIITQCKFWLQLGSRLMISFHMFNNKLWLNLEAKINLICFYSLQAI